MPQPPNRRILKGDGVNAPVDMQLAAVEAQLADVQAVARDNEHAERRVHHDLGLIEAVDILHAGDRQALAAG